jgi:plastocyanin
VRRELAGTLLAIALVTGCSDDDGSAAAGSVKPNPPIKATVDIVKSRYVPAKTRVLAGGTVTFMNLDENEPHTAETQDSMVTTPGDPFDPEADFDTHTLSWGEPYTVTFHKPGHYEFVCSYDPDMKGTVDVLLADPRNGVPGR